MSTHTHNQFDRIAERFERPAHIAREFGALADDYPDLARDLLKELAQLLSPEANGSQRHRGETQHQRVTRLFRENGNKPMTKQELIDQTGIKDRSLHGVIYGKGSDIIRDGKRGRAATYRLRTYVFQATGDD